MHLEAMVDTSIEVSRISFSGVRHARVDSRGDFLFPAASRSSGLSGGIP
jgi:hypothetical protein